MAYSREEVRQALEVLRRGTASHGSCLHLIRKANFTLADIGTSEEELEQLRIKGCKTAAQMCLEHLRRGSDRDVVFLEQLRNQLRLGNLSLVDIGTNAAELASFERRTSAA